MGSFSQAWIACGVLLIAFGSIVLLFVVIYCRQRSKSATSKRWPLSSVFVVDRHLSMGDEVQLKHIDNDLPSDPSDPSGSDNRGFNNEVDFLPSDQHIVMELERRSTMDGHLLRGASAESDSVEPVERLTREMAERIAEHQFKQKCVPLTDEGEGEERPGASQLQLVAKQRTAV